MLICTYVPDVPADVDLYVPDVHADVDLLFSEVFLREQIIEFFPWQSHWTKQTPFLFFMLKGTVSRDFLYPVFFPKQLLLVPLEMS